MSQSFCLAIHITVYRERSRNGKGGNPVDSVDPDCFTIVQLPTDISKPAADPHMEALEAAAVEAAVLEAKPAVAGPR